MRLGAGVTGAVVGAVLAGCAGFDPLAGLFPHDDQEDVTADVARAVGYRVPEGASRVYARTRGVMDITVVWLRYDLPREAQAPLREARAAHTWATHPAVPAHWPDFSPFAEEELATPPAWWAPAPGAEVAWQDRRAGEAGDRGTGEYTVFDGDRVYQWAWSWQWWGIGSP